MVTQLQPDVRAYLHGGEVIKRYIRIEEVAHEYGFSVEETEYIAKAASSLYKLTRIHLVKKERFDEFMKHIYKVPGTNKQIIKKFARIGEASIIYSIGRHRFIELARAAGATYKINEGTGGTVLINLEIFDNYMEQFRQPARPLKEPGKIYGLLGPNGAGKSTTMNIVTGYIGADGGTVKINGYDIFAQPEEAKKCIGYLPEIPPLYVDMTVYEYLKFVAELKKLDRKKRKEMIADVMDMTGITEVKNRLIKNLSKGYRQRVGFAQALLGYPEIIILDEPTVGLDPKQIIEIRELIKKLGENHTVILSSHILSEISAVCDHVFIISKGKLVASDATENLINLMSKNQEINLVLKSDEIGARGMLEKIVNIDKVTFEKSEEEKTVKAMVIAKANCDIREEIFELASAMHMPILEMHTAVKSLEDVFLELTGEGDEK